MQQNSELRDELPSEVAMLCSLLARIIYRCLKERDARLLALLKDPTGEHSGRHGAAMSGRTPDQSA
jgi:hypothetical protein